MKKMFLILPLLTFLSMGPLGCGLFHKDDPDENYWEEAESAPAPSSRPSKETQEKIDELSKTVEDSEAKVTILRDEVDDIQNRIKKEKDELEKLHSQIRDDASGGGGSSEQRKELERQIKILENDVKWLKWIQKNY